jgi:hypothetical protein
MKNKVIKFIGIGSISTCILVLGGYFLLHQLQEGMYKGETNPGFNRIITKELLDSSTIGLERFKSIHQHYPQCVGKYFFDSIKTLVHIPDVYVYSDSLGDNGQVFPIKKRGGKFDYLNSSHTYLGSGRPELTIIYRPLSIDSYKLYGVGENCLDEGGKGDDVVL